MQFPSWLLLFFFHFEKFNFWVLDTGIQVLVNTGPFLNFSIVCFRIAPAHSSGWKFHVFKQYWYTRNFPVFSNTAMFQYLLPDVDFFSFFFFFCYSLYFLFRPWNIGEPNNIGEEDCVEVYIDGQWNDFPCTNIKPYLCERLICK